MPIHPDIEQIIREEQRRNREIIDSMLEPVMEPIRKARSWARENIGDAAATYAAGDRPEFRRNSKKIAQTIFDFFIPQATPQDMAMAFIPGFTQEEAAGNIARGVLRATGKRLPGRAAMELTEAPLSTVGQHIWKDFKGPTPHAENAGWRFGHKQVDFRKNRFGQENLTVSPGEVFFNPRSVGHGLNPAVSPNSTAKLAALDEIRNYGLNAPMMRHQFGFGHELGHGLVDELSLADYLRIFGIRPDQNLDEMRGILMPGMIQDYAALRGNKNIYTPPLIRSPERVNYAWKGTNQPLEEMVADYVGSLTLGHNPTSLFRQTFKDPEPILQHMTLDKLRQRAGY